MPKNFWLAIYHVPSTGVVEWWCLVPIFGHPHAPHSYIYFWRGFDGGAIERKYAGLHMQMNGSPALFLIYWRSKKYWADSNARKQNLYDIMIVPKVKKVLLVKMKLSLKYLVFMWLISVNMFAQRYVGFSLKQKSLWNVKMLLC